MKKIEVKPVVDPADKSYKLVHLQLLGLPDTVRTMMVSSISIGDVV
jgi:hypothetical protein